MYHITICDDEPNFQNAIQDCLLHAARNLPALPHFSIYNRASELLNHLEDVTDLYILDILLPDKSGLELASTIRAHNPNACIIFVSSHNDAVFSSIRYAPFRFVRKESMETDLEEAFDSFVKREQAASPVLSLHTTHGEQTLRCAALHYIETDGHYLCLHTGEQTFRIRGKLSDLLKQLQTYDIIAINQSYAINLRFVLLYQDNFVFLADGKQLPVSRTYRKTFQDSLLSYQRSQYHEYIL